MKLTWFVVLGCALVGCVDDGGRQPADDPGTGDTVFTAGNDPANPFFQALGTNQRSCVTCHDPTAAWSITPTGVGIRFAASDGLDPIFRTNDGAVSPTADVSTVTARRAAYKLLLDKGLIRVGLPIPANAEFSLSSVADPYRFASASELSLFRRPLPSTNLTFVSQIMWDTRETTLAKQALDATTGHAQAMDVAASAIDAAVAFESSIYTAQSVDAIAGDLASDGASGGPTALSQMAASTQTGFDLYQSWSSAGAAPAAAARRASIRRGERLFDTRPLQIRGVAGITDQRGTCSTCHDARNVGSHVAAAALDIGTSAENRHTADLPLYTLINLATGQTVRTSDPGMALITGKWADIGRFKVPSLRALAMRAPYFHDGQSRTLDDVLDFYRQRFDFDVGGQDRDDLIAFLQAL